MRTFLTCVAVFMLLPVANANHVQTESGRVIVFDHRTGNEWWVEVVLTGQDSGSVQSVLAMDTGGPWVTLTKRSWGAWAASFHIEPGNQVRFQANWAGGAQVTSCWFTHPGGVEQCGAPPGEFPELLASTYVGPSPDGRERVADVAVDGNGNAFVVGTLSGSDFDMSNAFLRKYRPDASLAWTAWLSGSHNDEGVAVATDPTGNVYVALETWSNDLPANGWRRSRAGFQDAFVAKYSGEGSFLWGSYVGGSSTEFASDIGATNAQTVVVVGTTFSCDFPVYGMAVQPNPGVPCNEESIDIDGFVTKFTADGQSSVFSTFLGGSEEDRIHGVALSMTSGSAIVTGQTSSSNFPITPGAAQPVRQGLDAFVTKLDGVGSKFEYSTFLGGSSDDKGIAVVRDVAGNAFVVGETVSPDFRTTANAFDRTFGGGVQCSHFEGGPNPTWIEATCPDAFITKVFADGKAYAYSSYLGTDRVEMARGVAIDANGVAYVTGETNATDLPKVGRQQGPGGGYRDSFAIAMAPDGSKLVYSTLLGGSDGDFGESVATTPDGNAWYTGWTWSDDYPTTAGAAQRSQDGFEDGFLTRLGRSAFDATFTSVRGNEWWVQANVAVSGGALAAVDVSLNGGEWKPLTKRSWGGWAASYHIVHGTRVQLRATSGTGASDLSDCYQWIPAANQDASKIDCGMAPPPPEFRATVYNLRGNEWWIEADVLTDRPLMRVDTRVDGGTWIPMRVTSWGSWAASAHAPSDSHVQFRVTASDGSLAFPPNGWVWPQATEWPPPSSTFDARFENVKGNSGWVQVNLYSSRGLDGVSYRVNGGPWSAMTRQSYGDWTAAANVPDGSVVQFRAESGQMISSGEYRWPAATPVPAWPVAGSFVTYSLDTTQYAAGGYRWVTTARLHMTFADHQWTGTCSGRTDAYGPDGARTETTFWNYTTHLGPVGAQPDLAVGDTTNPRIITAYSSQSCEREEVIVEVQRIGDHETAMKDSQGRPITLRALEATETDDQVSYQGIEMAWETRRGLILDWHRAGRMSNTSVVEGALVDTDAPIK